MRSKKLSAALASTGVLALLVAAFATGAASATPPVGCGKASATKSVCGLGTGKKATGRPIKIGGIYMLIPGVDFSTIGMVRRPTSTASTTTAASTAARSSTFCTTESRPGSAAPR